MPLDRDSKPIRLLTLAAGEDASQISCTVTVVSLTATPLPQYEALSYCWGDMKDTRTITLRRQGDQGDQIEQQFTVTVNLARALRRLRHKDRDRTFVDRRDLYTPK